MAFAFDSGIPSIHSSGGGDRSSSSRLGATRVQRGGAALSPPFQQHTRHGGGPPSPPHRPAPHGPPPPYSASHWSVSTAASSRMIPLKVEEYISDLTERLQFFGKLDHKTQRGLIEDALEIPGVTQTRDGVAEAVIRASIAMGLDASNDDSTWNVSHDRSYKDHDSKNSPWNNSAASTGRAAEESTSEVDAALARLLEAIQCGPASPGAVENLSNANSDQAPARGAPAPQPLPATTTKSAPSSEGLEKKGGPTAPFKGIVSDIKWDQLCRAHGVIIGDDGSTIAVHSRHVANQQLAEGDRVAYSSVHDHVKGDCLMAVNVRPLAAVDAPTATGEIRELKKDEEGRQYGLIRTPSKEIVKIFEEENPGIKLGKRLRVRFNIVPNYRSHELQPKAIDAIAEIKREAPRSRSCQEAPSTPHVAKQPTLVGPSSAAKPSGSWSTVVASKNAPTTSLQPTSEAFKQPPDVPPRSATNNGQGRGVVVSWRQDSIGQYFGFITPDEGGDDVFVRQADSPGVRITLRDRVQFSTAPNPRRKGCLKAVNITVVSHDEARASPSPPSSSSPMFQPHVSAPNHANAEMRSSNADALATVMTGVIVGWRQDKHSKFFGHIRPDDGGESIYVHEARALEPLKNHDHVSFEKALDRNGESYRAINVRRVAPPEAIEESDVALHPRKKAPAAAAAVAKAASQSQVPNSRGTPNAAAKGRTDSDRGDAARQDPPPLPEIFEGTVLRWDRDKHGRFYGFISPKKPPIEEVYVHQQDNNGFIKGMKEGAHVTFQKVSLWYKDGTYKAVNVTVQ